MRSHSVLFIAYNFPPHGGAGVQRSLKFVKYLPEFGWQPIVVAATPDASPIQDPSMADEIPTGISVYRLPGFSISRLISKTRKYRLDKAAVLFNLILQIPDPGIFWAHRSRRVIAEIIKTHKPEVMYTTSGPYSTHLLGKWAKQQFDIPWLADFRDPWSCNLLMPYLPGYRWINRRLERQVLQAADRVTCVSEPWLSDLCANLGDQAEKFFFLPNGYDETDIQPLPDPDPIVPFTITYFGSFYRNRSPSNLIQAVEILIKRGTVPSSDLCIRFIGKNTRGKLPHSPIFETYDYIPHKELNRYRMETDVLLLILDASPTNVGNYSGKIYEYLASNRPILATVPPGGVAQQMIEATHTGLAVGNSPEVIAGAIQILYQDWKSARKSWSPKWEVIRQYTRRNQTSRLAAEFSILTR